MEIFAKGGDQESIDEAGRELGPSGRGDDHEAIDIGDKNLDSSLFFHCGPSNDFFSRQYFFDSGGVIRLGFYLDIIANGNQREIFFAVLQLTRYRGIEDFIFPVNPGGIAMETHDPANLVSWFVNGRSRRRFHGMKDNGRAPK